MRSDRLEKLQGPLEELLVRLRKAQVADKVAEKALGPARRAAGCSALIGCVGAFYGLPLAGVALIDSLNKGSLKGLLFPLLLAAWVVFWVRQVTQYGGRATDLSNQNLDDDKLSAVLGLVELLQTDLGSDHTIDLELDLRVTQDEVLATSHKLLEGKNLWLKMQVRLPDKRKLSVEVLRSFKRKLRSKRRYTKVGGRCWDQVTLRLSPALATEVDQAQTLPLQLRQLSDVHDPTRQMRTLRLATEPALFYNSRFARGLNSALLVNRSRLQAAVLAVFQGQPSS